MKRILTHITLTLLIAVLTALIWIVYLDPVTSKLFGG